MCTGVGEGGRPLPPEWWCVGGGHPILSILPVSPKSTLISKWGGSNPRQHSQLGGFMLSVVGVPVESVLDRVSQGQSQIGVPHPRTKNDCMAASQTKTVRNADQLLLVPRFPLTRRARPGVVQIIVTTITEVNLIRALRMTSTRLPPRSSFRAARSAAPHSSIYIYIYYIYIYILYTYI